MVDAVTYILENDATVQGLVGTREQGTTTDYKVFPVVVFEGEKPPYIVVSQVSQIPAGKNCDYTYGIQVTSWAGSYDEMKALNQAVIDAIIGYAPGTVNGVEFGFLNVANSNDAGFDDVRKVYGRSTTFEGSGSD